ncbi:MAG: hypothetical protein ACPHP8_09905 [Luminiphilus sp.]
MSNDEGHQQAATAGGAMPGGEMLIAAEASRVGQPSNVSRHIAQVIGSADDDPLSNDESQV